MIAVKTDAFESNRMIDSNAERCAETQIVATFYEVVPARPTTWIRKRRSRRRKGPTFERRRPARECAGQATLVLKSADLGSGRFEREIELRPEGLGTCIRELFVADQLDLCYGRVRVKATEMKPRGLSPRVSERLLAVHLKIGRRRIRDPVIEMSLGGLGPLVCEILHADQLKIGYFRVRVPVADLHDRFDWIDSVAALISPRTKSRLRLRVKSRNGRDGRRV